MPESSTATPAWEARSSTIDSRWLRFRAVINPSLAMGTVVTNTGTVYWNDPTQTASASVSIAVGGMPGGRREIGGRQDRAPLCLGLHVLLSCSRMSRARRAAAWSAASSKGLRMRATPASDSARPWAASRTAPTT